MSIPILKILADIHTMAITARKPAPIESESSQSIRGSLAEDIRIIMIKGVRGGM